jgi:pimeloyl-ACP methyl ester carboxylesterase
MAGSTIKECIYFAHGNGFPSPCYRQLFSHLEKKYTINWIDMLGHNPEFPVTENWHYLITELIDNIERVSSTPVIALGHSLGGVLSVIAAIERPDLIKQVVLIDSPLIGRFISGFVRLAKALGIIDRITPAEKTKNRIRYWQTRDKVLSYLKKRELFQSFTSECMEDFVDYGLEKREDGLYLRFDRHIEYLIYRTLPHTLHQYEGRLSIPAYLIYGEDSTVVSPSNARYMLKKYGIQSIATPGSHMLPMEHPARVADLIVQWLEANPS